MRRKALAGVVASTVLAAAGWALVRPSPPTGGAKRAPPRGPVPVEVAPIEQGAITLRTTYSGSLESPGRFVIAANVRGRVERLHVDLADPVERGALVAELEDDELGQLALEARAELRVARARAREAAGAAEIAERELERLVTLQGRGVVSPSQLDAARAESLARRAAAQVARAEVARARAALDAARVRLGYTRVVADWACGLEDEAKGPGRASKKADVPPLKSAACAAPRVVAERMVDAGDTVEAGQPLLAIASLDPLRVVLFVPERAYRHLRPGIPALVETDAWPGRQFSARVSRVSPVFDPDSRQARVELLVPNPSDRAGATRAPPTESARPESNGGAPVGAPAVSFPREPEHGLPNLGGPLRPGMFVRVTVTLRTVPNATIVPEAALTRRSDRVGVFFIEEPGPKARFVEVEPGIREGERVELLGGAPLTGEVVTLGQQLIDDGVPVTVSRGASSSAASAGLRPSRQSAPESNPQGAPQPNPPTGPTGYPTSASGPSEPSTSGPNEGRSKHPSPWSGRGGSASPEPSSRGSGAR